MKRLSSTARQQAFTMIFSFLIFLALAVSEATSASLASRGHSHCRSDIDTPEYHAHIATNYLNLWGGQLDLLNETISPVLEFQADRLPLSNNCSSGAGSRLSEIHSNTDFGAFITGTRAQFIEYEFDNDLSFGGENNVVVRWSLRATIGTNFQILPTTLKPGEPVTYNGTDILVLNKCTGLADKIFSAQDLVNFFHNLGLKAVTV